MSKSATLWTVACQAPLPWGSPSKNTVVGGLLCPSPGDLPHPWIEPASLISPVLASGFFTTSATWEALFYASVQFSSVAQLCPTLCNPMNRSTPGLPVHHQLPEFTQTHVRRVSDAIQPSHPLLSPSPSPQSLPASECFPMSQLFA